MILWRLGPTYDVITVQFHDDFVVSFELTFVFGSSSLFQN